MNSFKKYLLLGYLKKYFKEYLKVNLITNFNIFKNI